MSRNPTPAPSRQICKANRLPGNAPLLQSDACEKLRREKLDALQAELAPTRAAVQAAHGVRIRPAVTDATLMHLGRVDPSRACGELDAEDQAILTMTLEDICAELLDHRAEARRRATQAARQATKGGVTLSADLQSKSPAGQRAPSDEGTLA